MFDEFGDPIDTGGGTFDMTSYNPSDAFGGGVSNDMGIMNTAFSMPKIIGGLRGNPGALVAGAGAAGALAVRGGRLAMRKVWEAVKKFGPEMTAGALGYTAVDLVTAIISSGVMTHKRRRRGISSRDIRTTRRVCRFAHSLNQQLAHCGPPRRRTH